MSMLNLHDILTALEAPYVPEGAETITVSAAKVDSRAVSPGEMFVAMVGERVDGHDYVARALTAGATVALVEHATHGIATIDASSGNTLEGRLQAPVQVVVPDTLVALQTIAAWWRRQHDVTVIGVTGSVGKTTAKEVIATVLEQRFGTLRNPGNYNNEIGLPLTLLGLRDEHQCVVLEMGMYALGEIELLARIAQPQIGVVMNVEPVHLERLGSIDRIAQAKGELIEALPENGLAVLYGDTRWVQRMVSLTQGKVQLFGIEPSNDIWVSDLEPKQLEGTSFCAHVRVGGDAWEEHALHIALVGRHAVLPALAATGVAAHLGLTWPEIARGLASTQNDLRLTPRSGTGGSLILDDTYNASPLATMAAFDLMRDLEGRRIAVLGDMLELGDYEARAHREVGTAASAVLDMLITVGERAEIIAQAALEAGMHPDHVMALHDKQDVISSLANKLGPDDVVLIKGSRGMAMETIVEALAQGETQ